MSDNLPHTTVELLAIQPDSVTREKGQLKKMPLRPPFTVDPDYVAVFRVNIIHPKKLGTFNGEITITTSFERVWHIPVYYKTAVGSLKTIPEKIVFQPTFPVSYGIILSEVFYIVWSPHSMVHTLTKRDLVEGLRTRLEGFLLSLSSHVHHCPS